MTSPLSSQPHTQWLPVEGGEKAGKTPSDSRLFYALDRQGHVLMATPFTRRCLGYVENQLENQPFLQLLHPDDREEMAMHLFFRFEGNEDYRLVCRHLCEDGKYCAIRWDRVQELDGISYIFGAPVPTAKPMARPHREAPEEERKQEEPVPLTSLSAELARTREELARTREELEMLAYVISHDLRAPIRHIVSYSELLKDHLPELSEDGDQFWLNIQQASRRLSDQTQALVSYSRIGRWQVTCQEVDLAVLIQEALQPYQAILRERQIQVTISQMPVVQNDPHLLKLILTEVLDNAIKFTSSTSKPHIRLKYTEHKGQWMLRISDNGIGFNLPEGDTFGYAMRSLHHPRYHPEVGVGMGLARAKRAIGRLGGSLSGEGREGLGAMVFLCLPVVPPSSLAAAGEAVAPAAPSL